MWLTRISGDSGPCPRAHGFDQHPGRLWTMLGAVVLNSYPRELALGPSAPGVDQWSRATPVQVGGRTVSTSCPGRLTLVSDGLRGQPALTGHSGLCPRAHRYYQLSWVCRARVRLPAGLNSSLG